MPSLSLCTPYLPPLPYYRFPYLLSSPSFFLSHLPSTLPFSFASPLSFERNTNPGIQRIFTPFPLPFPFPFPLLHYAIRVPPLSSSYLACALSRLTVPHSSSPFSIFHPFPWNSRITLSNTEWIPLPFLYFSHFT